MNYIVYFENSWGIRREIGRATSTRGAYMIINDFLDAYGYKSYYKRTWTTEEGETCVDVGSWSEFFYIKDVG